LTCSTDLKYLHSHRLTFFGSVSADIAINAHLTSLALRLLLQRTILQFEQKSRNDLVNVSNGSRVQQVFLKITNNVNVAATPPESKQSTLRQHAHKVQVRECAQYQFALHVHQVHALLLQPVTHQTLRAATKPVHTNTPRHAMQKCPAFESLRTL
jgi:hypothetical protein